jgi:CRP/FNR family transcriptional regulator, cyclic AMP receptor protein
MESPLLDTLSPAEQQAVLATARRRRFGRREVVFHEGDPADTIHLVRNGRFAVFSTTSLGDTAMLAVLGSGEFFGELGLVRQEAVRTATVVALEDAETRSIHRTDFARLQREHPAIGNVLIAALAVQVARLSRHLVEALYVPADRRLLNRLAELGAIYRDGVGPTTIPLTQEDLAELAGTSRATVNRVLRDQERLGVIELQRGRTVILDPARLPAA